MVVTLTRNMLNRERVMDLAFGARSRIGSYLPFPPSSRDTSPSCDSRQIADPDEIVHGAGEDEHPADPVGATMTQLPHQAHRFQPAEDLFHPFARPLADLVAWVPRRPPVDRAALRLLGDVRRDIQVAHRADELFGVVPLVRPHGAVPALHRRFIL